MIPPCDDPTARSLAEIGWLRRLARDLCADAHAADDAVQDTLVAVLARRPDARRPLRGWLATVLHNALRLHRRTARRTAAREAIAARAEAQPSAAESAARVELHERLLGAVRALPEPLRATVVARWFDDLPPRRVAALHGVPVATVKARLSRALAELRAHLDRCHGGDRRAWVTALFALQPTATTFAMKKATLLAGAALLALPAVIAPLALDGMRSTPPPAAPIAAVVDVPTTDAPSIESAADARTSAAMPEAGAVVPATRPPAAAVEPRAPHAAPAVDPATAIAGLVLDRAGAPAAAAVVLLAGSDRASAETTADGTFVLSGETAARQPRPRLFAFSATAMSTFVEPIGRTADGRVLWQQPIVLHLNDPTSHLAGTVVRGDGTPVGGARVWIQDPTPMAQVAPGSGHDDREPLENLLGGRHEGWQSVRTGADGRFRIDGLLPRTYHLTAMTDRSVLRAEANDVAAGREDVLLQFDEAQVLAAVRGRTVDRHGLPVAHVRVRVTTNAFSSGNGTWMESGDTTRTDADGTFVVRDVPLTGAYLRFDSDEVLSDDLGKGAPSWPFAADADLRIVLVRRCPFRVELLDPAAADAFRLLDAAGEPLQMTRLNRPGESSGGAKFGFVDGASGDMIATDAAATLVLLRGAEEVRRVPVGLVAGQTTVLRY